MTTEEWIPLVFVGAFSIFWYRFAMRKRLKLISTSARKINGMLRLAVSFQNPNRKSVNISSVGFAWKNNKEAHRESGDFSTIVLSDNKFPVEVFPNSEVEISDELDLIQLLKEAPVDFTAKGQVIVSYNERPLGYNRGIRDDTFPSDIEVAL